MSRVVVIVEGPTEESFVKGPLAEALCQRQVYLNPIILGVPGHKGGKTDYVRVQKDILRQLKQDLTSYCSTMIDFYGLGQGFPGTPPSPLTPPTEKSSKERSPQGPWVLRECAGSVRIFEIGSNALRRFQILRSDDLADFS